MAKSVDPQGLTDSHLLIARCNSYVSSSGTQHNRVDCAYHYNIRSYQVCMQRRAPEYSCPCNISCARPCLSQKRTDLSFEPETIHWPSCEMATWEIQLVWPFKSSMRLPNGPPASRALLLNILGAQ